MSGANRVKVACRIRPALDMLTGEPLGEESAVEVLSSPNIGEERKSLRFDDGLTFTIDHVYDQKCNQEQVFEGVAKPLVGEAFRGFNCTLFSYGQTGSGKTYTLQGKSGDARGIVPRTVEEIFRHTSELQSKKGTDEEVIVEMHLSIMEIYQERLKDLLSSQNSGFGGSWGQAGGSLAGSANLRIREHTGGSVWVEGLTEVLVTSGEQFTEHMGRALKKRATGSHAMNLESSRSHLICIISLRQSRPQAGQRIFSKIHLIDLAGSEMVRKTDASGQRMAEAKHINKSLSALGNVINALTAPGQQDGSDTGEPRRNIHVPFRDSKLTRLLQDSLGGNAKTVLVLAISESKIHCTESVNTLRFGERARQLCTKPTMNTDIVMDERKLRAALARAEAQIVALTETIDVMQAASEENGRLQVDKTPRNSLPLGFSGTLGVPGGLSPAATPIREAEPQIIVEKEVVYVEKNIEPEEVFCSQCAVILAEVAERVPASKVFKSSSKGVSPRKQESSNSVPNATSSNLKNRNERMPTDYVHSRKNLGSGGGSANRAAPNLHSSSFRKVTGGGPGGGREKEREKARGKSSDNGSLLAKSESSESLPQAGNGINEPELDLLGLWQKQQEEEQRMSIQSKDTKPQNKETHKSDFSRDSKDSDLEPLSEEERRPRSRQESAHAESKTREMQVETLLPAADTSDLLHENDNKKADNSFDEHSGCGKNVLGIETISPSTPQAKTTEESIVPLQYLEAIGAETEPQISTSPLKKKENPLSSAMQESSFEPNLDAELNAESHEEIEAEADGRCAVCGLDEEQTNALCADTGESLGFFFMCDGNCGDSYHARCVGLVDSQGLCLQPEGEWFCSNCTFAAQNDTNDLIDENLTPREERGSPEQRGNTPLAASALKAEYHAMRRERNRVLTQWQQEKRVATLVEERNKQMNQKREEEHCATMERFKSTEKELESERAETVRLRALCDELMRSLEEARGLSGRGEAIAGVADLLPSTGRERRSRLKRPVFDVPVTRSEEQSTDAALDAPPKPEDAPQVDEDSMFRHVVAMKNAMKKHDEAVSTITGELPLPDSPRNASNVMPASLRGHIMPAPSDSPLRALIKSSREGVSANSDTQRSTSSMSLDDYDDLEESYESVTGSMSAGSSKLKGRLRDLLRTVKEEAGSYAEIRARREQKLAERRVKRENVERSHK